MANATVTITNDIVSVDPERLPAGSGANVNLHWKIKTPGWTFPSNGIVIANPGTEFSEPEVQNNGTQFKWKDKNTPGLSFKYTITVTNGTTTKLLDPTIINRASR